MGSHLVRFLVEKNVCRTVSVLDKSTQCHQIPGAEYYEGDISSKDDVRLALQQVKPRVIFHTASPPASSQDLSFLMRVNVQGTQNLLEATQELQVSVAFIYTSSASVVHDSTSDLYDADESFPLVLLPRQKEPYTHSKAVAEDLVIKWNRCCANILTAVIRPSGLFGEHDLTTVKPMVEAAAAGKYKSQIGNGKNLFDWTYVENAVDAHVLAAQALLKASKTSSSHNTSLARVDGEAFIITNDEPVPFWDFARSLGAAAGYATRKEDIRVIPKSLGLFLVSIAEWLVWLASFGRRRSIMTRKKVKYSTLTRTFRIDKAKRILSYRPRVDMATAVRRAGESFAQVDKKSH